MLAAKNDACGTLDRDGPASLEVLDGVLTPPR
jgi:hypothetical protein